MATTLDRTTDFAAHLRELGLADDPSRRRALDRFLELGIPTSKNEEWKYTPMRDWAAVSFEPATEANVLVEDLPDLPAVAQLDTHRLIFVNGDFCEPLSDFRGLSRWADLMETPELIAEAETTQNPFVALNQAFSRAWTLRVKSGAIVDKPILLLNLSIASDRPIAAHPRFAVKAEDNSKAKIIEAYYGLRGTVFTNAFCSVKVASRASIEHIRIQEEGDTSFHISTTKVNQQAESTYISNNVSFGALLGRNDIDVWIGGEHAETALNGAYMAFEDQLIDNHTRIDHAKPNCHSFEVYKGILGDRGTGVFNGKIYVHLDAQKTDAKQSNKALLLSKTATMNSKPQLEIFADDVKCTHGATVGQIEEDQLFYLRSRGLKVDEARSLLVYAFVSEVLDKIGVREVRDLLEARLFERVMAVYRQEPKAP